MGITNITDGELDKFVALSSHLTGFSRFELMGTGQARAYLDWVNQHVPQELASLQATFAQDPAGIAKSSGSTLSRRIIKLWYMGKWFDEAGKNFVIPSPDSYVAGLMWQAISAHPMGAKQQGFAAWAEPPLSRNKQVLPIMAVAA